MQILDVLTQRKFISAGCHMIKIPQKICNHLDEFYYLFLNPKVGILAIILRKKVGTWNVIPR